MTGPQQGPQGVGPYGPDPAAHAANPASGPHGYPSGAYDGAAYRAGPYPAGPYGSGPYPADPQVSGFFPPGGFAGAPGMGPGSVAPQDFPSGQYPGAPGVGGSAPYPVGAYPGPSGPSGPGVSGPQQFGGSGPYPGNPSVSGAYSMGPDGSGAYPGVPGQGPDGGWSYGLPTGPRPDLLQTPIGQAGALRGASWQQNAVRGAGYPSLVWAELRKLFATMSDRVLMILAPIMLIGSIVSSAVALTSGGASVADQAGPLPMALSTGLIFLHIAIIKAFTGEWHYRSVQLSLLLQSSRAKYLSAQFGAITVVWFVVTGITFAVFLPMRGIGIDSAIFQYHLNDRILWFLGATALTAAIGMMWCMVIATLIPHPTAAIVVYFVLTYLLAMINAVMTSVQIPAGAVWVSPYALSMYYIGKADSVLPGIVWAVGLLVLLALGTSFVYRRDAR